MRRRVRSSNKGHTECNFALSSARLSTLRQHSSPYWQMLPLFIYTAKLTASAASAAPMAGGASIAAHVDHVRHGLSLMNRWSQGEHDPWSTADWRVSWNRTAVNDQE